MSIRKALQAGFVGATGLALTACASIGGTGISYQPPSDFASSVRGAIAPNRVPQGAPLYRLSVIENASQSATNGCGAQAIFINQRTGGYLHLSLGEMRRLTETGQTKDRIITTVYAHQFARDDLRTALRGVENLAARNSRSGLCFGYN